MLRSPIKRLKKKVHRISKLHTGVSVAQYLLASVVAIVILPNTINTTIQYYNSLCCVCNKSSAMDF